MKKDIIYALDFDGVLCDSALETGMAGWKAASVLWDDMRAIQPEPFVEQFRLVRPLLETGYEAIAIMRLLYEGESVDTLLAQFAEKKQALIDREALDINQLKILFGQTRDSWIQDSLEEWLSLNPLFPGIAEKLQRLTADYDWYILTTKQERFVIEIFKANRIALPEDRVFGLDRNIDKNAVLSSLLEQSPNLPVCFIEDRLPALVKVMQDERLPGIHLQLVNWGYNLPQDRSDAQRLGIDVITLESFTGDCSDTFLAKEGCTETESRQE